DLITDPQLLIAGIEIVYFANLFKADGDHRDHQSRLLCTFASMTSRASRTLALAFKRRRASSTARIALASPSVLRASAEARERSIASWFAIASTAPSFTR